MYCSKKTIYLLLIISITHSSLFACSTCYGDPDAPAAEGINYAIITLLGITGGVLSMIVRAIYSIGNKAKKYNHGKNFEESN